jgi:hypothetical protein
MRFPFPIPTFLCLISLANTQGSIAQEQEKNSANAVAQKLANPNSDLAKLTFKNEMYWFDGKLPGADKHGFGTLFQPSFPISLNDGYMIFARPAIPIIYEGPVYNSQTGSFQEKAGLGDMGFDLSYGHSSASGNIWSVGITGSLPTATKSELGNGQVSLGPELFIAKKTQTYIVGIFPSHQWDVAGWGETPINQTSIQPLALVLPGNAWIYGTNPTMTYDWETDQWTVPINVTVAKTIIIGETPWRFGVEVNYYTERSDAFGPRWMLGFNVTPVVRNVIADWFHKRTP